MEVVLIKPLDLVGTIILRWVGSIPNDLQRPSLNRFTLNVSSSIQALLDLSLEDKDDMDAACKAWKEHHLLPCPRHLPISTTLPFLAKVIQVIPDIYEFPAKELHVD